MVRELLRYVFKFGRKGDDYFYFYFLGIYFNFRR